MAVTHPTAVRTAVADFVVDQLDEGTPPGTLVFQTSGDVEVATLTFSNPAFGGVTVYNQWAAIDVGANPASIITSNAIRVTTGVAGTNPYTSQSNWQYTQNVDAASQSSYEYGTIVRFSGALQ